MFVNIIPSHKLMLSFLFVCYSSGLGSRCYSWKGSSWWGWGGPSSRINICLKYSTQRGEFIFNCYPLLSPSIFLKAISLVVFYQTMIIQDVQ